MEIPNFLRREYRMENFEEINAFSKVIFARAKVYGLDYMDAIVSYCEETETEIESIIDLISPPLKVALEEEAMSLNLIRNNGARL